MRHIDPRESALDVTPLSSADAAHLALCAQCTSRRRQYARVVAGAHAAARSEELEAPGPQVWLAISAQLGLAGGTTGDLVTNVLSVRRVEYPEIAAQPRSGSQASAIAAVLITGLVLAAIVVGVTLWPSVTPTRARVLASATLDAMPAWPNAAGTAVAQERADGSRELEVSLSEPAVPGETREVWLLTTDASDMLSLGFLDGANGLFALPEGIDLAEWSLVDVSDEPPDGDPVHSGNSIVRGALV